MANPPFNQKQWRAENELVDDPRWNGYEVPPTSNANYGWILNIVSKLSQNGVAGFLLANGALSDDGTELKIRQQLIENHLVEAIIILPRNLFYTTDISVTLWVLNKNKKARVVEQNGKLKRYRNREDEILFMDLRQMGSPYEKKYIELTEEDRAKVTSVYHNWQQEMCIRDRGKNTFIFIDEIYLLFQHEYSANFLFTLWKRVRKYSAYASGITQNVDDLLQSHTARTMLANSEFIIMLNQASTDRLELAKLLNISDLQMSYITNVEAGHGLIKVGSSLVPFANKFPKNTKLYKLMTTKPGEA